jgi:hypothetical protein
MWSFSEPSVSAGSSCMGRIDSFDAGTAAGRSLRRESTGAQQPRQRADTLRG